MTSTPDCECCEIVLALGENQLVNLNAHWTANVAMKADSRPWLVVQSREHSETISDLSMDAQQSLGSALGTVTAAVLEQTSVRRSYVLLLNEGDRPHVHFHITASFDEDTPTSRGPQLLGTPAPEGISANSEVILSEIAASVSAKGDSVGQPDVAEEPSALVRALVALVRGFQRHNLHSVIRSWLGDRGMSSAVESYTRSKIRSSFAEIWVVSWTVLLVVGLFLAQGLPAPVVVVVWIAATYRLIELAAPHLVTLLDRRATTVVSFERSLLLVSLNVIELSLIIAIYLSLIGDESTVELFSNGFRLATLRGEAGETGWLALIEWIATLWSLLLLVASASIAMGRIAERLVERVD